jgi:hypothetical protein
MRRLIRIALSLVAVAAFATLTAATIAAGNYAETSIVDGADTPPTAGEERELRLLLLQHGVTPVDFGSVQLTAFLPGSGESVTVTAAGVGGGEWVATVTFPAAGDWQLRVLHSEFETPPASAFTVGAPSAAAWLPATGAIAATLLVAVGLILVAMRLGRGRATAGTSTEPARAG